MPTREINCKAGHTWRWEVKRGRVPHWCPDHHPSKKGITSTLHTESAPEASEEAQEARKARLELAREVKAQKAAQKLSSVAEEAQAILADPTIDLELRLKLSYAHARASINPDMAKRRVELIREAKRRRV